MDGDMNIPEIMPMCCFAHGCTGTRGHIHHTDTCPLRTIMAVDYGELERRAMAHAIHSGHTINYLEDEQ